MTQPTVNSMPPRIITTSRAPGCYAVSEWEAVPPPATRAEEDALTIDGEAPPLGEVAHARPVGVIRVNGQWYRQTGNTAHMSDRDQALQHAASLEAKNKPLLGLDRDSVAAVGNLAYLVKNSKQNVGTRLLDAADSVIRLLKRVQNPDGSPDTAPAPKKLLVDELKPSHFKSRPMDSRLQNNESEIVAANIMRIRVRLGDEWPLSWKEYERERTKDGNFSSIEKGFFDAVYPLINNPLGAIAFAPGWERDARKATA